MLPFGNSITCFLPKDFPQSVTSNYSPFTKWSTVSSIASSVIGVISTQSLLTAVGLSADMQKGLIDRFRSLPISRSAVVFGRTLGDGVLNIVVLAVMGLTGFLVGWRPTSGAFKVFLGFVFLFVFGFAMSWVGVLIGLSVREERVAQNVTFIAVFPLTFLSNAFAPTTGMPKALQYFAEWNPVSTMVAGCRELFGLKNEFGATAGSFPSENPLLMSIIYMILIMAIFVPLSVRKYNNAAKK